MLGYEFTSFWITRGECDFHLFRAGSRRAPGETRASHGRKSPNTDVGQRGRSDHGCVPKYLDVATLLYSQLVRRHSGM
jgi:hypothetical protein